MEGCWGRGNEGNTESKQENLNNNQERCEQHLTKSNKVEDDEEKESSKETLGWKEDAELKLNSNKTKIEISSQILEHFKIA